MMQPGYRDYSTLHFLVLIWGFTSILGVLISVNAPMLVLYRTALAGLIMLPVLVLNKQPLWPGWRAVSQMMVVGTLIAIHWYLFFVAARVTNVSACLAGISTGALWTSFLEPLITRRPFRWFEPLLALLAVAGLYLIFLFQFDKILGVLLGVASAGFAALFSVFNSIFSKKYQHQVVTFYEMVGAALFSLTAIVAFLSWPEANLFDKPFIPTQMDVLYLLLLAGICTVYAYSESVLLMKKFTAFSMNLAINMEPVYGILLALLFFGKSETMHIGFYAGTLVIMSTVFVYPFLEKRLRSA